MTKKQSLPKIMDTTIRKVIAEHLFGGINWVSSIEGYCKCPGASEHTTRDTPLKIFLDGAPSVHCLHTSCSDTVRGVERKFRSTVGRAEARVAGGVLTVPMSETTSYLTEKLKHAKRTRADASSLEALRTDLQRSMQEDRERAKARAQHLKEVREGAAEELPRLLANPVPARSWLDISPVKLTEDEEEDWRLIVDLFRPEENVWTGQLYDSGSPEHALNFRPAAKWLLENECPGPFISPSVFKDCTYSRAKKNVLYTNFFVVESDELSKSEVGAVFKRLMQTMPLIAIVDTGGKSLHAWFIAFPHAGFDFDAFRETIIGFRCDPSTLLRSQPCRMPGCIREETGKWQKLIYLDTPKLTAHRAEQEARAKAARESTDESPAMTEYYAYRKARDKASQKSSEGGNSHV